MTIFSADDADAWYRRNKNKLGVGDDPVMQAILMQGFLHGGERILELGCSNGWRLDRLRDRYKADCWGIELSPKAAADVPAGIKINQPAADDSFDLVIAGFCMYLLEPDKLFEFAYAADRFLVEGGHLIVYDFYPDYPHSVVYSHNTDLRSRKMDHVQLWLAHPAYRLVARYIHGTKASDTTQVAILKKNMANAFPLEKLEADNVVS